MFRPSRSIFVALSRARSGGGATSRPPSGAGPEEIGHAEDVAASPVVLGAAPGDVPSPALPQCVVAARRAENTGSTATYGLRKPARRLGRMGPPFRRFSRRPT